MLMIVMSPEGYSICFQQSVSILCLMRSRERVSEGFALCVEGYTVVQSLNAIVVPNLLIAGSWRATISIPCLMSATLEMRACWQVLDLLTFCCQIVNLLELLSAWVLLFVSLVVSVIIPSRMAQGQYWGGGWRGEGSGLMQLRCQCGSCGESYLVLFFVNSLGPCIGALWIGWPGFWLFAAFVVCLVVLFVGVLVAWLGCRRAVTAYLAGYLSECWNLFGQGVSVHSSPVGKYGRLFSG